MPPPTHPRRFYKNVHLAEVAHGFAILLDGRTPKTPAKNGLILPNAASAQLVANEWEAQSESVIPATMPLTRLANVVIDRAEATKDAMVEEVVRYATTDLVCYRAPSPQSLVAAQAEKWDPLLAWAEADLGIRLSITTEALAIAQPAASLAALRQIVAAQNHWHLTALAFATGLTGSAIIGLSLLHGVLDGEAAFAAIRIEEDWQAARWGRDPDEALIANARRLDLIAIAALTTALGPLPLTIDAMSLG